MSHSVRWNLAVSPDTDQALRLFLATQGGGKKGDLSRVIEEAVRTYIFERTVQQAKLSNSHINEKNLLEMVEEAVNWARGH